MKEADELKADGAWELLNEQMRMLLENDWEQLPVPVVPIRGSKGPLTNRPVIFYAMGIVDTLYRITRGENFDFDLFFKDKPFFSPESSEPGDMYMFVHPEDERHSFEHICIETPQLLISRIGVCLGKHRDTKLFLGGLPITGFRVHSLERMTKFCRLHRDKSLNESLRVYRREIFESPEAKEMLLDLLIKKDELTIDDD